MIALIDGDIIKYSVGFASDSGGKTEPVEYALHSVKQLLGSIQTATKAESLEIYLTGTDNYREKVAVTMPYKGNRDRTKKPRWYKEIHDYLVLRKGATVVNGREADDAMGCAQMALSGKNNPQTVICTLDKDLDMIPGLHYNWRKDKLYDVSMEEADYFFYKQLLMGDRTDNIAGIPGIGVKKAEKIVNVGMSNTEKFDVVYAEYVKKYGASHGYSMLEENANLLWIQREDGVLWQRP